MPAQALAQTGTASGDSGVEVLTAVPESPAFLFLRISPTEVTRPGSVRDFGAAILSGINEEGDLQQGVALETTPWFFIPGLAISVQDYQRDYLKYLVSNAQLSLATARAAGDSASTDLAFGLRFTLWDEGDPMRSSEFTDPLGDELLACLPETPDADEEEAQGCVDEVMRQAYGAYNERTKNRWNARRAALGMATGVRFVNSEFGAGEYGGFQVWLVGSNPATRYGQILAQVTLTDRQALGNESGFTLFSYGGRLLAGSSSFNGFLEVIGEKRSGDDEALDGTSGRWSAGVEFRLARELWLSTGFGSRFATIEAAEKTFIVFNLRWGLNSKARLDGLRG